MYDPSVITAEDVSALVIPDGCVGLPTLAAVEQGIPVVAVRNNTNLMRNDLRALPFRAGQLQYAAELLRGGRHPVGDEGGRCPGDDRPADAAAADRARCGPGRRRTARPMVMRNGHTERQRQRPPLEGRRCSRRLANGCGRDLGGGGRKVTGRVDQERAPIYETLTSYARVRHLRLPHARPQGRPLCRPGATELVGKSGLALDLPAMTATDNTFHPTGCVRDAQQLAADLFGAGETFFLSAGSTLGVATALLAAVPPGGTVALPRNIHRSVVAGLVLSGARAAVRAARRAAGVRGARRDAGGAGGGARCGAEAGGRAADAAELLRAGARSGGSGRRLPCARRAADRRRSARRPFCIFCREGGPQPALAAGADLVVQSCHKTLGSLVGSAQLHVGRKSLVEPAAVQDALNFLQTTSPSFLLLASLDVMRRWMWREGRAAVRRRPSTKRDELEDEIDAMPGLQVFAAGERSAAGRPSARSAAAGRERERHRLERVRSRTIPADRVPGRRRNGGLVQRGLHPQPAG